MNLIEEYYVTRESVLKVGPWQPTPPDTENDWVVMEISVANDGIWVFWIKANYSLDIDYISKQEERN